VPSITCFASTQETPDLDQHRTPRPRWGPRGPGAAGDDQNLLRQYAEVLRRRWKWVGHGVVVGLLGGLVSSLLVKEVRDPTTHHKDTNTLIANGGDDGSGSTPNLQQIAFLVRSADVSAKVATQLGISIETYNDLVTPTARSDVLAIDVAAIDTDPAHVVRLADATATVLNEFVATDQEAKAAAQRDDAIKKQDDLKAQIDALEAQIARNPSRAEVARAERDSLINQLRVPFEEIRLYGTQAGPSGGLSTLQSATPVQINAKAYNARLDGSLAGLADGLTTFIVEA